MRKEARASKSIKEREHKHMTQHCSHLDQIREVTPSANGCEECLKTGDSWVHLPHLRACTPRDSSTSGSICATRRPARKSASWSWQWLTGVDGSSPKSLVRKSCRTYLPVQFHRLFAGLWTFIEAMATRKGIKPCMLLLLCIYNDTIYRYIVVQSRREPLAGGSHMRQHQLHLLMRVSCSL